MKILKYLKKYFTKYFMKYFTPENFVKFYTTVQNFRKDTLTISYTTDIPYHFSDRNLKSLLTKLRARTIKRGQNLQIHERELHN